MLAMIVIILIIGAFGLILLNTLSLLLWLSYRRANKQIAVYQKQKHVKAISRPDDIYQRLSAGLIFYTVTSCMILVLSFICEKTKVWPLSWLAENVVNYNSFVLDFTGISLTCLSLISLVDTNENIIFKLRDILNEMRVRFWIECSVLSMVLIHLLDFLLPSEFVQIGKGEDPFSGRIVMVIILIATGLVVNVVSNCAILYAGLSYLFEKGQQSLSKKLYRVYAGKRSNRNFQLDALSIETMLEEFDEYYDDYLGQLSILKNRKMKYEDGIHENEKSKALTKVIVFFIFAQIIIGSYISFFTVKADEINIWIKYVIIGICIVSFIIVAVIILNYKKTDTGRQVLLEMYYGSLHGIVIFEDSKTEKGIFCPLISYTRFRGKYTRFIDSIENIVVYAQLMHKSGNFEEESAQLIEYINLKINELKFNEDIDNKYYYLPLIILLCIFFNGGNENVNCYQMAKILEKQKIECGLIGIVQKFVAYA